MNKKFLMSIDGKKNMIHFHAIAVGQGVWDSICLWKISSSKTLRNIVLKVLPLYVISSAVGTYFMALETFVVYETWRERLWLQLLWLVGWGVPIYVIGSLLQLRFAWVVTSIITSLQKNSDDPHENKTPASAMIAEGLYGVALSITYLTQTYLYCSVAQSLLPSVISSVVGKSVNVAMIAWATSFAAFECKLIVKRCDLHQRIRFLETRWSYALGYGLSASLIYNFFPRVFATSLWQFMQLLLTLRAITVTLPSPPLPFNGNSRLRIFRLAQTLATTIIKNFT